MTQRTRPFLGVVLGMMALAMTLAFALTKRAPSRAGAPAAASGRVHTEIRARTSLDGGGSPEQPEYVLVWLETEPPGATIRRLKDNFVLGRTPETVAMRRSNEPVTVRFELSDFRSEIRDVSAAQDGSLSVLLQSLRRP